MRAAIAKRKSQIDPITLMLSHPKRTIIEARFWQKADKSGGPESCWPWTGAAYPDGTGRAKLPCGYFTAARRVAFAFTKGFSPGSYCTIPYCQSGNCVNPAHHWLGEKSDVSVDAYWRGNSPFSKMGHAGSKNGNSKLTVLQVLQIMTLIVEGENNCEIGRRIGITHSMVSCIRRGKAWGEVLDRAEFDPAVISEPKPVPSRNYSRPAATVEEPRPGRPMVEEPRRVMAEPELEDAF